MLEVKTRFKNRIMLVEDRQNEILAMKQALSDLEINENFFSSYNFGEALTSLKSEKYQMPDIILLDLSTPFKKGFEFLTDIKSEEKLKWIPVIILSESFDSGVKKESYRLNAAGYFLKPVDYSNLLKLICSYWSVNELPSRKMHGF